MHTGRTRPQLSVLFAAAGPTPHTPLRTFKNPEAELDPLDDGVSEDALLRAMVQHSIVLIRPALPAGSAYARATRPKRYRTCRQTGPPVSLPVQAVRR